MSEPARRFVEEVRQAQRHRKFARLTIAEIMTVETNARGQTTCLTIPKQELVSSTADLEKLPPSAQPWHPAMPKQTGRRLLVQRQLLTTVLTEATWKDGMLRTTLLEPRKLNKSQWKGWVGTGRDFEDWLPGRTRTCGLLRAKHYVIFHFIDCTGTYKARL
jgi:hypothetical protein